LIILVLYQNSYYLTNITSAGTIPTADTTLSTTIGKNPEVILVKVAVVPSTHLTVIVAGAVTVPMYNTDGVGAVAGKAAITFIIVPKSG
jgi:hypothetical protein